MWGEERKDRLTVVRQEPIYRVSSNTRINPMFSVIVKVYGPTGEQTGSEGIAEFSSEAEARAMADRLTAEDEACPPNLDEGRYEYYVEAL
jgi:hypothetical protein